jgi:LysR family transcriptional regulator, low CO2-responsive transcriptional regulator
MSTPPTDIALEDQVFLPNPLVLVALSDHPSAGRKRLPWTRICKERFILWEQGSGTRMACEAHFRATGLVPQLRLELGSSEAIKQAVRGGLGLWILSVHSLGPHFDQEGLTLLDAVSFPIDSHWHLVRPKGRRLSPLASEFCAHLLREAAEEAPYLRGALLPKPSHAKTHEATGRRSSKKR